MVSREHKSATNNADIKDSIFRHYLKRLAGYKASVSARRCDLAKVLIQPAQMETYDGIIDRNGR